APVIEPSRSKMRRSCALWTTWRSPTIRPSSLRTARASGISAGSYRPFRSPSDEGVGTMPLQLHDLDQLGRDVVEELARRQRQRLGEDGAHVGGREVQPALRPGDADVAEPPLLLEPARLLEGA